MEEVKRNIPEHILNVAHALISLGVRPDSKFCVNKCSDVIYKVFVNQKLFGLFDNERKTFVE